MVLAGVQSYNKTFLILEVVGINFTQLCVCVLVVVFFFFFSTDLLGKKHSKLQNFSILLILWVMAATREQQENAVPLAKGAGRMIKPWTLLLTPEENCYSSPVLWHCRGLHLYRPLIGTFLRAKAWRAPWEGVALSWCSHWPLLSICEPQPRHLFRFTFRIFPSKCILLVPEPRAQKYCWPWRAYKLKYLRVGRFVAAVVQSKCFLCYNLAGAQGLLNTAGKCCTAPQKFPTGLWGDPPCAPAHWAPLHPPRAPPPTSCLAH